MMHVFGTLATLTCLIQFLSVFFVFKKVESTGNTRYRIFQVQFLSTWGYFFSLLYREGVPGTPIVAGVSSMIILACMALFFHCSSLIRKNKLSIVFSEDSPQFHISKGPYSCVRHPFYTSYIFTYVAVAMVMQSWILTAMACSMFVTYYLAARYEESKFLNSNLKDSYRAYMDKTGMFFPKWALNRDASEPYSKVS
ncbi:methyltransferase family protein [Bdellovibrio sp. HCB2-146]|uniref:methyltransferase family protein n=1 Tax=Bdellovibrio sp. HCB2-146 TaxID=3394362 RepID=UPI0039BD7423